MSEELARHPLCTASWNIVLESGEHDCGECGTVLQNASLLSSVMPKLYLCFKLSATLKNKLLSHSFKHENFDREKDINDDILLSSSVIYGRSV